MADFSIAFDYMIGNEDYPSSDPRFGEVSTDNDGGLVRFGINSKSLGKELINTTYYTTMPNDEAIGVAKELYSTTIWAKMLGDEIVSQRMASKIFDMAVNSGDEEAAKLTQRAASVNVSGTIDAVTIGALNSMTEIFILNELVFWDLWFVKEVIKNHPEYKRYMKDWNERAQKLP